MTYLFSIPQYQLYLLQLENYEISRFWKLLLKRGLWPKGELRKGLVWTQKAKAVFFVAEILILILTALIVCSLCAAFKLSVPVDLIVGLILIVVFQFFSFLFFTLAVWLLYPLDAFLKHKIAAQAKAKLANHPKIKIIGIAGSYGKTTMKEMLKSVLSAKFKVLSTPESVNTPVGIGRWILEELREDTEIVIVELGEHYRGDIRDICDIVKLDIAVIIGINEAHLERLGSLENTVVTIFEATEFSKKDALVVLNADDKLVVENYQKFIGERSVQFYSSNNHKLCKYQISNTEFHQDGSGQSFVMDGEKYTTRLLAEYALGDAVAAGIVAQNLGESINDIKIGIQQLKPVEHRLQPITGNGNVLVIDDSYNGNPEGVRQAIAVLQKFDGRRKIYLTPGLVEMGDLSGEVHREIGRDLAGVADVVILIRNSVTQDIELGIMNYASGKGKQAQIVWFDTVQEAHASLGKILKSGDVILFQNDWGDNYL